MARTGFLIKVCGLSTEATVRAAVAGGANLIGFVFHPKSPRYVTPAAAATLKAGVTDGARSVALLVDPDDRQLDEIMTVVCPDVLQLHGRETPARVEAIRRRTKRRIFKAIGVASAADLSAAPDYADIAELLVIDAKPPNDAAYPGGHGKPFDWSILQALDPDIAFLLSGGLRPDNVAEALGTMKTMGVRCAGVDVSSGVEIAPGMKDIDRMMAFFASVASVGGPQDASVSRGGMAQGLRHS